MAEVTGAPIVIADGLLGFDYRTVPVNGDHFSEAKIAPAALDADAIISVAHFKGHMTAVSGRPEELGGFRRTRRKTMMHSDVHPGSQLTGATAAPAVINGARRRRS